MWINKFSPNRYCWLSYTLVSSLHKQLLDKPYEFYDYHKNMRSGHFFGKYSRPTSTPCAASSKRILINFARKVRLERQLPCSRFTKDYLLTFGITIRRRKKGSRSRTTNFSADRFLVSSFGSFPESTYKLQQPCPALSAKFKREEQLFKRMHDF